MQIINNVNVNQSQVHTDGITIECSNSKCKIVFIMALSIITILFLMSPQNARILVSRIQIRGERFGWKAVKHQAEGPATEVT